MFGLGPWELLVIFLVILLLFGAKRLPEIAQGMGKGIREFKRALRDTSEELKGPLEDKPEDRPSPNDNSTARKDEPR